MLAPICRAAIGSSAALHVPARSASFNARTTIDPKFAAARAKVSPVWGRSHELVCEKAQGSWVWGTDGRKYLDFSTGIAVCNTGHCHPTVVAAIQKQAGTIIHAQLNNLWHKPLFELIERMQTIVQLSDDDVFYYTNSGAEAIEASMKLARQATSRTEFVAFKNGFHGRTFGAASITSSKHYLSTGYRPLLAGAHILPFANPFQYAQRYGIKSDEACTDAALQELDDFFHNHVSPNNVAAMIVEPIQGEGGFNVPPDSFLVALRKLCDQHGILLIFDEVQSGMGRSGKWFAHQWIANVRPDIMLFAKGIASGMPLSGMVAPRRIASKVIPGTHGGTYGGNAVSIAAAVATIDAMKEDRMLENANARGAELIARFKKLQQQFPHLIGEVRGRGLMVGIQFFPQHAGIIGKVQNAAFDNRNRSNGLLILQASNEVLRLAPPLNVSKEDATQGAEWFCDAVADVAKDYPAKK